MTNEELLHDLKQFITAAVSQATTDLATKKDLEKLETKMNERFAGVDERFDEADERFDEVLNAIGETTQEQAKTLKDHEVRITRLEHKVA